MRIVLHIVLICLSVVAHAQNLVPNPGFEDLFTDPEYQWVQPQGASYHYAPVGEAHSHSGEYINGICMYSHAANEYLHIKLVEPVKAGEEYILEFSMILADYKDHGYANQRYLGVYFGNEVLDTREPSDLYEVPQIRFTLPDSGRYNWFTLHDTITLDRDFAYMTIGYFDATREFEQTERYLEDRGFDLPSEEVQEKPEPKEDMSWLYLPPDEQKAYIKAERKRAKKKGKKEDEPDRFAPPKVIYQPADELAPPSIQTPYSFSVRYYFDDICLRLADLDSLACTPQSKSPKLEPGQTIELRSVFFESGSAQLINESESQLLALKQVLDQHPEWKIEVQGHTDNVGQKQANQLLSQERAAAVVQWLTEHSIDADRLSAVGFGDTKPIGRNDTEEGRRQNRRVAFLIK